MQAEIALDAKDGVGEGPFWDDAEATLWWVDIPGKAVHRWHPASGARKSWPTHDFPSAVVLRRHGGALVALRDGIYALDLASGRLSLFCELEPDRPENRTNEAKCDPAGNFWVGTMQNNLHPDGSPKDMTASTGALYRISPDGAVTRMLDGIGLSNTLAWTADGRTLLFADTLTGIITAYPLDAAGRPTQGCRFTSAMPPGYCDGSAIDSEGALWNCRFAAGRVIKFKQDGSIAAEIPLPVTNPTSCCFGDADLRTLYVTSARFGLSEEQLARNPQEGAVLRLRVDVPGTPSVRFAG